MTRKIRDGLIFGYLECDIEVPEDLRSTGMLDDFPQIFKNIEVLKHDIGEYMRSYAEENYYLMRPRKMFFQVKS